MAAASATVRGPGDTVSEVADATTVADRTWAIDEEVIELVKLDSARRGVRYYSNLGHNAARTYNVLRKRLAAGGDGTVSKPQIVRDLYPGIETFDDAERVENSVRRWLRLLERVGLVSSEPLTVGTGKWAGLRYELLDVADAGATMGARCARSSVGSSVGDSEAHTARRRRLPKKDQAGQRVRRHCPRAGRGAIPGFVDEGHPQAAPPPKRAFFSPERFVPSRASVVPPTGVPQKHPEADAYARGKAIRGGPPGAAAPPPAASADPASGSAGGTSQRGRNGQSDALERACPIDQLPALRRLRQEVSDSGTAALRALGRDGTAWSALALAAWGACLPGLEPRFSRKTSAQLDRSASQLCRFWERGDVVDLIVDHVERLGPAGVDPLTGDEVRTLAYVVLTVKQWARSARRHALGKPAPRPWRARGPA